MKLEMDLSPGEMIALGYCIGTGITQAESRKEETTKWAIESLAAKIYEANKKAEKEPKP